MIFPPNLQLAETPPSSVEEAEERLLALLKAYAETERAPLPATGEGQVQMAGTLNLWMNLMQAGVGLAFQAVTGKPVPVAYQVNEQNTPIWSSVK